MVDEDRKKNNVKVMVTKEESFQSTKKSMGMLANKSLGKMSGISGMSRMIMRRMSYGFGAVSGIKGVDGSSQCGIEFKVPQLLYLSTYQLDPHPDQVFNVPRVTKMVNQVLNKRWDGHEYNVSESPALTLRLASELMLKVMYMNFNRYRIISIVTIVQKRAQSYNNAIAFLWDHERDKYVDVQRECTTNFIHVTIFGIYLD